MAKQIEFNKHFNSYYSEVTKKLAEIEQKIMEGTKIKYVPFSVVEEKKVI